MVSYSSYTLEKLEEEYGIVNKRAKLFENVESQKVTDWLKKSLLVAEQLPIKSEKARSEMLVVPILIELRNQNDNFFTIYSGEHLNIDDSKGLRGECDFILAKDTASFNINLPIIQIVEAKKHDIDIGIPQCAAQMLGARIFNEQKGISLEQIYGCVTTGDNWQFMKLQEKEIIIDTKKYYLGNIQELLGVFQQIIDYYKKILT